VALLQITVDALQTWPEHRCMFMERFMEVLLLHNGGSYNGCIRTWCLKNATNLPFNDVVHSVSVIKDESNKNV
jgi:hypothetical protein